MILINKTISIRARKAATADIKDYYLHSKLAKGNEVYMLIKIADIPEISRQYFNIAQYIEDGDKEILACVTGGLYGMPEAGYLAQSDLVPHLEQHGFMQTKTTPCLFKHTSRDIEFTLVVDDFGISYSDKADAEYLFEILRYKYPIKVDWTGSKYIGFDINWHYSPDDFSKRKVELSMPTYIQAACTRFGIHPTSNTYTPETPVTIVYGSTTPQMNHEDTSALLTAAETTRLQQIVGVLLYYGRALDATILCTCSRIASRQNNATQDVLASAHRLLNYCATYPTATLVFYPSDMILKVASDASYNSETNGRSRAANFKFLGRDDDPTFINGPIECVSTIIPTVVTAASEAEYAGVFIAGKGAISLRYTLNELDCIQPATPLYTDNKTAAGIASKTCRQKRSKSMDMRYHWIRDRVALKDFEVHWKSNAEPLIQIADFLSKPHTSATFATMRPYFVKKCDPAFPTAASRRSLKRVNIP